MLVSLCAAACVTLAIETQVTWHDVTLGAPGSTLRSVLGDPLRIVPVNNARVARYWLPGANSTYLLVVEERGYITAFEAFTDSAPDGILDNVPPDPSGIRLGDTLESVKAKHPGAHEGVDEDGRSFLVARISPTAGAAYAFQDRRVRSFHWTSPLSDSQPDLPQLTAPAGDSPATALLDAQQNETDGVAWEYRYLAFHPCVENLRWQLKSQSLLREGGRAYDRLHVVCSTTKVERDFYFDITSYFGKLK